MGEFKRIFKYVWPQWPRVLAIFMCVMLIAVLFAGSFATVIPLLKVMMGQEGLHGWADRKVCDWRYGISFYVPEYADFGDGDDLDTVKYLLVTDVDDEELAAVAGLKFEDKITKVSSMQTGETSPITGRGKILAILSQAADNSIIKLNVIRSDDYGNREDVVIDFSTGNTPEHKKTAIEIARWGIGLVPKVKGKSGKKLAVISIIIFMGIITIIRCIARFIQQYIGSKVVQVSVAQLREDAFAHAMEMPVGFFVKEGTSDTISRLIGDIGGTGAGIKVMLGKALREPAKAIACLGAAMLISWKLVLIFMCCAPFTIGFAVVLGKRMKKYTKRTLVSGALMLNRLRGAMNALRVVKVYNQQGYETGAYKQINRRLLKQTLRAAKVDAGTGPIMEVIGMFAGSAALLVGVHWMTQESNPMDSPSFFGLLILLGTSAESIRKASDVINKIQKANAAAERVFAVIDQPAEDEKADAVELEKLQYNIEFRNITFTYPGCEEPVLKGVNLSVQAGHNIAVVGPNGSGKTTLINLIPRFYNADSGAILIDGQDIRDVTLKSLRDQIAMVTQNVVTFNDTIAANIAYGRSDASMDEIIDAANRSFAHEFIEPLPDGYDTVIGEDGSGLSGGQLQRIVIARAILKNPPILIFDEATSQVDAKSESKIHSAIEEIMRDRTSFVIAHRFSTVISADTIVVMDEGRIVAQGSHAELMKDCKLYQGLHETQLLVPEDK